MDKDELSKYLKFQIRIGKRKVKSETFEYLAAEYGSLKSIALIFMMNLTSDGERKGLHCHMIH